MKRVNLFAIAMMWIPILSLAGTEGGGGGNFSKTLFVDHGKMILNLMKDPQYNPHKVDAELLLKYLNEGSIEIEVTETRPTIPAPPPRQPRRVQELDAKNFCPTEKKIQLYRPAWEKKFEKNRNEVYQMILHELLPCVGVKDDQNQVSSDFKILFHCEAHCYDNGGAFNYKGLVSGPAYRILQQECNNKSGRDDGILTRARAPVLNVYDVNDFARVLVRLSAAHNDVCLQLN